MRSMSPLFRIVQFATIKVIPGVFNIVLIPYLLIALGTASYGLYSTWLSYIMLVANTLAAVATQPMYRYLSSNPLERQPFATFTLAAALLAGMTGFAVALLAGTPWLLALGFGTLAVGTVLGTAVSIDFVIAGKVARLAAFEAMRILMTIIALAVPILTRDQLVIGDVVLAMALSNVLPIVVLAGRHSLGPVDREWLNRVAAYGLKSAIWLVLAGLPVVGAKTILIRAMPDHAFGTYAAIADLTYRGFAIANAALMMWAFPLLSRQFDDGKIAEVRRTLRFALLIYALGGVVMLAAMVLVALFGQSLVDTAALPGGLLAVILITVASFSWHAMSISHKPFELTLRTTHMAALMGLCVAAFYALTLGLIRLAGLDAFFVVMMSMIGVAFAYMAVSLMQRLER